MSKNERRWSTAQAYEKQWWQNHIDSLNLEFYQSYAEEAVRELKDCLQIEPTP